MPMIQAHALNLSFGTGLAINQVLHDVSLSVADGESFGLVGESGSGMQRGGRRPGHPRQRCAGRR